MYDATQISETSTSVSILFKTRPELAFVDYVARMETALRGNFQDTMRLSWDHEDVAMIDVDGSRVLMGYWTPEDGQRHPDCDCEAILVLSVGPGPDWQVDSRLNRFAKELCTSVVDGITERHPADLVLWKEFQGVVTTEDFDMLVDQAMSEARARTPAQPAAGTPGEATLDAISAEEKHQAARQRMQALAMQLSRHSGRSRDDQPFSEPTMDSAETPPEGPQTEAPAEARIAPRRHRSMRPGRQEPALPVVANDTPQLPVPHQTELERIRAALYPPEDDAAAAPGAAGRASLPLLHRLTVYAANTTLMLVALPVGAALMTYNVLGGEDARTNARAVALTGAVLGLAHTGIGHALLSLLS